MNNILVIALCTLVFGSIIGLLLFIIMRGVGFNNLLIISRARKKLRKGYGLVKIFYPTGYPRFFVCKFSEDGIEPFGEGKGKYVYKQDCVYYNEYNLPTIEYHEGDIDPINHKTRLTMVTSPKVLANLIVKGIRTETSNHPLWEWLKKNWFVIGIMFLVLIGGFLFLAMHQSDLIAQLATAQSQRAIIPA